MQIDFKNLKIALIQLAEERGLTEQDTIEAIEAAFAAAYKKEYAKQEHIIKAHLDPKTGEINFSQAKQIVDDSKILPIDEEKKDEDDTRIHFNIERHIWKKDAVLLSNNATVGQDILFPLEQKKEFGRIAAQAAKQAVFQHLREAEKKAVFEEFSKKEGQLVVGEVRRYERGSIFVDLGRTIATIPFAEQIRGERFNQSERIRAIVLKVDMNARRGQFVTLSRAHPEFVKALFKKEVPEYASGMVNIKKIVREPRTRTKIVVESHEDAIDAVGSFVGQRGIRVLTVMSELSNEKIDIIGDVNNDALFVEESLSPATVIDVVIDDEKHSARVTFPNDQTFFAVGFAGKNVLLAHKLTGFDLTLVNEGGNVFAIANDGSVELFKEFIQDRERRTEPELTKINNEDSKDDNKSKDKDEVEKNVTPKDTEVDKEVKEVKEETKEKDDKEEKGEKEIKEENKEKESKEENKEKESLQTQK